MKSLRWLILLLLLATLKANSREVRIVAPYAGLFNNVYSNKKGDSESKAYIAGAFLNWTDPYNFNSELEIYGIRRINSELVESRLIVDYYLNVYRNSKFIVGFGNNYIQFQTGADLLPNLENFHIVSRKFSPFIRAGHQFRYPQGRSIYTFFSWVGYELDVISGDYYYDLELTQEILEQYDYWNSLNNDIDLAYNYTLMGAQFTANFNHILEVDCRGLYKLCLDEALPGYEASATVNLYLNRNFGFSYRFRMTQDDYAGHNCVCTYQFGGLIYIFPAKKVSQ